MLPPFLCSKILPMKYRHITFLTEEKLTGKQRAQVNVYMLISTLATAVLAVALIITLLFKLATVDGTSMNPTLEDGDHLLISSWSTDYERGDIVVIGYPSDTTLIKRVIAVAGDTIDFDFTAGEVYLNGQLLNEPYIKEATHLWYVDGPTFPLTVPEGYVFVMGDNRNNSLDSRSGQVGLVNVQSILGKSEAKLF